MKRITDHIFKYFVLIFLLILYSVIKGQEWKQFKPEYNHLPENLAITVIKVDKSKNIWFGTEGYDNEYGIVGGLAKFDGKNWTQYTKTNSTLPDGDITAIAFDIENNTWIGMKDSGLAILKNDTIRLVKGPFQFIEWGQVKNILTDKKGNVWILYKYAEYPGRVYKSALMKYDGVNWVNYDPDSIQAPEGTINTIALDKDNNLYCGSYDKILKYNGSSWTYIDVPGEDIRTSISCLKFDRNGTLWVGTDGIFAQPLMLYEEGLWKEPPAGYPGGKPKAIVFDNYGNTWIGGGQLVKYNGEKWEYFNRKNSAIIWNGVGTLAVDSTGVLWCGTALGACTFDGENWKYYASSGGLPDEEVRKVIVGDEGIKWVATNHFGLVKYDGNTWQVYDKTNSGIPFNDVDDIAIDSEGKVWVATGNGLGVFDGELWVVYNEETTGYPINNVWDIEIDSKDKIWIYIFDQNMLASFDGNEWQIYNSQNTILLDYFIDRLAVDSDDNLWVGTNYGFFNYNGTEWKHFTTDNSDLPDNWVQCFAFDSTGNSWVGTENGVARIKGEEWEIFKPQNTEMVGFIIDDIALDSQNNIWVGFSRGQGIAKYDGVSWKHYNKEFEPGSGGIDANSLTFDKKGNIWIGNFFSGLIQFNEDKIVFVEAINNPLQKEEQNVSIYPNPFNSQTNIVFTLNETSNVKVKIYSITGELVRNVAKGIYQKGKNTVAFEANDLPTGVYICILETTPFSKLQKQFTTQKILLLK